MRRWLQSRPLLPRFLLLSLLPAHPVWAQNGALAVAPLAPYVDREIEGLAPPPDEGDAAPHDRSGWPRYLRAEGRAGTKPFDTDRRARIGYGIYGLLETPNHGTLSIDGTYASADSSGTVTLRQRAMPLDGGWLTSNELGVINPPVPAIVRKPSRVFLPYSLQLGLSTTWENPGRGLQWMASSGEPGRLDFLPASGFGKLSGRRTAFAGQWRIDSDPVTPAPDTGWTVALRHEDGRRVSNRDTASQPGELANAQSTLLALRHEGATLRLQAQAMTTQSSLYTGSRQGFWVDGEWDEGPRTHSLGAYRLQRDLNWAHLPMANDLAGANLRSTWRTRQWSAEGSIDWIDSVSGRTSSGFFATGSARWRLNRDHTLGAGATVRGFGGSARNTYLDWRIRNGWGTSGLRLESTHSESEPDSRGLAWDQEWLMPQSWALSTSLGVRAFQAGPADGVRSAWTAAISFSAPLTSRSSLRGNLTSEQGSHGQFRHGLNLGANWRMDSRWSLETHYHHSLGRSQPTPPLDPLAPFLPVPNLPSDRSFYLVLRYELEAGSRDVPLGGQASEGGGRIEGTVYFDNNRSHTQEASEGGVPNAIVFLDNRYAARTDSQGRFEFPFVASGARTVSVRSDSLPLPWNVVDQGQATVEVRRRDSVFVGMPVQRSD